MIKWYHHKNMLMQKAAPYFIVVTIVLFTLQSCEKKKPKAYYPIPPEMLSFIQHSPGAYYIYQDSATGLLDSVLVTASELVRKVEYLMPSGDTYLADYFHLVLEKSFPTGVRSPWLNAVVEKPGYEVFLKAEAGTGRSIFWFPYLSGNGFQNMGAVKINGLSYQDVHSFSLPDGQTCWWVQNVGIIKITNLLPGGLQTFTLVRKG